MEKKKNRICTDIVRNEAVKRVNNGERVGELAKLIGVSRKCIYGWVKRYKNASARNKHSVLQSHYVSGAKHPKSIESSLRYKILCLVVKHPSWSIEDYATELGTGKHGLYNFLKKHDLTTVNNRLAFGNLYYGPGKIETDIKVSIVKSIQRGDISVTSVAREYNVSRKTVYSWIARYNNSNNLKPAYASGVNHHRGLSQKTVDTILNTVRENPALSIHELARLTEVSSHGIYNVLSRHNLTTKQKRLNYAQNSEKSFVPQPAPIIDKVKSVLEQFTPQKAPAPPTALSLLKTFLFTTGASSLISLSFVYWIDLIINAPSLSFGIGIVFAGISLFMGTLFFLYSFKYYITLAIVLSYSQSSDDDSFPKDANIIKRILGLESVEGQSKATGLESDLDTVTLNKYPYVSVQIPFFNEKYVAERAIIAATNFDYKGDYEVFVCDDSTDETTDIIRRYLKNNSIDGKRGIRVIKGDGWELRSAEVKPGVTLKHLHRTTRSGFKGAALKLALTLVDPKTEFISVFDADFVPYPDTLDLFIKYFKIQNKGSENFENSEIAAVQGYQWHVLNKSENWITRGVRSEYSGSYVIERSGQEVYGGLKHISGSVYMIRKKPLEEVGWHTSITEDYELTLRLYEAGYKVMYTPYIQAPAECVSTLKRLIRQRMRWAEGHSFNVKVMWKRLLWGSWHNVNSGSSMVDGENINATIHHTQNTIHNKVFIPSPLTVAEKIEFLFNMPYYLQAFFFLVGTIAWLLSEAIFPARLPFWTSLWGWSLVFTNMFALPLVNAVGLFLEESEERDYSGLASFILLSYILVPFQAYAAMKGFLEKEEGGWFRTPKTGAITDVFKRGTFYRFVEGILPNWTSSEQSSTSHLQATMNKYISLATANNTFNDFSIKTISKRRLLFGRFMVSSFILLFIGVNYMGSFAQIKEVVVRPPTAHQIQSDKTNFALNESPEFIIVMPQSEKKVGGLVKEAHANEQVNLTTKVYFAGSEVDIPVVKEQTSDGNYKVTLLPSNSLRPGKYNLVTSVGGLSETQLQSQFFTWGVLAVNFNKPAYKSGDTAEIGIGVVDDNGNTVCDADIEIHMNGNSFSKTFSTTNGDIEYSSECGATTVTNKPDYSLSVSSLEIGSYDLSVTAIIENGERTITDSFEVYDSLQFDIERKSATRIYPPADYLMSISISPREDFKGQVIERVPESFEIEGVSYDNKGDVKLISWDVDWKKGETYDLTYTYDAPDISPEFYLLGPLELYSPDGESIYKETRSWQIAADAVAHDATTDGGETTSFSHTVNGSDRVLLVFVNMYQTTDPDVSSISYNGSSMSKVTEATNNWVANRYAETQVWSLANPSTGSNTVSVTLSGTPTAYSVIATSYTGVDTADPIDATNTNIGNSSNPTVSLTTENANSMIVGGGLVIGGDTDPFTPGTGTTERWDGATGTSTSADIGYFGGEETTTTVGSYTYDFTSSASDRWTIAAVEVVVPEKLLLFMFLIPLVPYYMKRRRK